MSTGTVARIRLNEISITDPRLTENRWNANASIGFADQECAFVKDHVVFRPPQLVRLAQSGSIVLSPSEFMEMVRRVPLYIPSETNPDDTKVPLIGQRKPTAGRRQKIYKGWVNTLVTPDYYTESIRMSFFGATISQAGIRLNFDSGFILLGDGGGRVDTVLEELYRLPEGEQSIIMKRGFIGR